MTLPDYIKKRNGVPLGAKHSLRNMLFRSLGAGNFASFWKYWNPIWGYYLGMYVFKPLKVVFPLYLAVILTFVVSGAIHDAVTSLILGEYIFLLTPWFFCMGIILAISNYLKIDYSNYSWFSRAIINTIYIGSCFILAYQVRI